MARRILLVTLILAVSANTMLVGCSLGSILTFGSGGGLMGQLMTIPLQMGLALLLDMVVGPLLGDPAGDLGKDNNNGTGNPVVE